MTTENLSSELCTGNATVTKRTIPEIDEIQSLEIKVNENSDNPSVGKEHGIGLHGHQKNQWEVWIYNGKAYICLKGKQHKLVVLWPEGKQHNITSVTLIVQAIKGHGNETYEELKEFFESLGLSVAKGSLIVDATNLL